jgi:two-component system CheB/CheR fusion protein
LPDSIETVSAAATGTTHPTYIVGIGASAGGLEALERVFQHIPAETGMAFVVVQHLSPDFRSLMDELLARWTRMKIHRVTDGMPVEANSIYLIPPKKEMTISKAQLFLEDKDPETALSLPIDHFLKSLAADQHRNSIAIILSGTGSDGSRGIDEVKRAGGLVIAQSEQTAKFDGMPHAARETGSVHLTLDPEDIGPALVRYSEGVEPNQLASDLGSTGVDEDGLSVIYRLLRDRFGLDFSHYKLNTIVRRTERRLQFSHIETIQEYAQRLADDSDELDSLYRDLLVGVTRFFRDAEAYQHLGRHLDAVIASKNDPDELRVWVAGCGTGEEAYSIAILIRERLRALGKAIPVRLFATDVHQRSLITAGSAHYSEESTRELSPELRERYFRRQESGFVLSDEIRHDVVFAPHNIIKDAPFTRMDLISCRNLLIYLQPAAQRKALSLFHFGLKTGGLLFLGPSESPGELDPEFGTLDPRWKIYTKKRDIRLPIELRTPAVSVGGPLRSSGLPELMNRPQRSVDPALLSTYEILLNEFVPSALLISERHELIHVFGTAGRFLHHRTGRVSRDVLDQLDSNLHIAITGAIQQIRNKRKSSVTFRGISVRSDAGEERVEITVRAVVPERAVSTNYLVLIHSAETASAVPTPLTFDEPGADFSRVHSGQIDAIEAELRYTRESLQATVEELETSNEELQATNEELVASNEELQSTNEELHSVNEELYTVNAEHQRKIVELTTLTDDMDNVLTSTRVHTVFLDRELRIRKFTPLAAEIFGLLPQDLGRSFEGFAHRLRREELNEELRQVLQTGEPLESESQDAQGNWFLVRILPYETRQTLDGVLLTLIEIGKLKQVQQDLARREFELRTITNHVPALIAYVDQEQRIRFANQQFVNYFARGRIDVLDQPFDQLFHRNDFQVFKPAFEKALAGESVEFEHRFAPAEGPSFWTMISVTPDRSERDHAVKGMFVCMNLVTALKEVQQRFDRVVRGTTDGVWEWNVRTGKVYYSPKFCELLGFAGKQIEFNKIDMDQRVHPDDLATVNSAEQFLIRAGAPMDVEFRLQCHDGAYRWFRGRAAAQRDAAGNVTYASGSIHDIEDYRRLVQDKQLQVEQRDQFLAMLSHELRNPLGAVMNGCRLLQRKELPTDATPLMNVVNRQLTQMASLLDDLLDVARITKNKIELNKQLLDLRHAVTPAAEAVQHLLDERRQTLEVELPSAPITVLGDVVRLQQVVANLLANASKYSPPNSTVRLELKRTEHHAELRVIDQGNGIPPELVRRVFEPFEQLGKTNLVKDRGLGLGLTVAESLVQLHGGKISAHSDGIGRGSEFRVQLSVVDQPIRHSDSAEPDRRGKIARTIVLIEDNDDARRILQELLTDDGYTVFSAGTGREGLQRIRETSPDAAIIDIGLPDIDGFEVARTIRADFASVPITLVALTGFGQPDDVAAALAAGFDAHLTKPVSFAKLESILQSGPGSNR